MPEDRKQPSGLVSKIDELESLIDQQDAPANTGQRPQTRPAHIPILDDLVTAEDYDDHETPPGHTPAIGPRLSELADRLEQKFSTELDEIVNILKGNLKESIMSELQTQLNEPADKNKNAD